jgi:hypothetical protein
MKKNGTQPKTNNLEFKYVHIKKNYDKPKNPN